MTVASIDIGSNTVLMLIAEIRNKTIYPLAELQRIPRISAGLLLGGTISKSSETRLMNILMEYYHLTIKYRCEEVIISATSAFRKAANGDKIKINIEKVFNKDVDILSGDQEAELAFLGTMEYGSPGTNRLVIDIGGGSTEIICGEKSRVDFRKSFEIGVVSISEKYFGLRKPDVDNLLAAGKFIRQTLKMLPDLNDAPENVVALAGTPVALACIKNGITIYDEKRVEGTILNYNEINKIYKFFSEKSPDDLLNLYPEILKNRQDLILSGTYILLIILELLNLNNVLVSTKGIRYGAIFKRLNLI